MLTPGDVVELDLGTPVSAEAELRRPAIVVTADRILRGRPNVVQVVPLTRTIRESGAEVIVDPDELNGLVAISAAQCQHIRSIAIERIGAQIGNVSPVLLRQIRNTLAIIVDI
ncbi:MAG: type II toxin-antitoxin system PemK/MazF family toxin [Gulosibacter sp.]|uniref:type II toxin-antitoxin system PemK/MazF family toxin n=1 Tax=Gulosibacter sp. TaxID=2817531 RepID=UPI003F92CA38